MTAEPVRHASATQRIEDAIHAIRRQIQPTAHSSGRDGRGPRRGPADHAGRSRPGGSEACRPTARHTFDQDDLTSGQITDSSGNGLTASLVNGSIAHSVEGTDGGRALTLPGGAPGPNGAHVRLPREMLGDATDLTVSARVKWGGDTSS
ncbi:hypothetical protein ACFYZB_00120 [Streptomyces sp. NPDC001852]|uniref:hypothetical protein n=1 Tax=Streptomyces sp. NPDC001852 TaxID=3364619 RepID=UPI00368365C9